MNDVVKTDPVTEDPKTDAVVTPSEQKPGDKTDPALLLDSLHKEREKRRLAEESEQRAREELARLAQPPVAGPISDEGRYLKNEIDSLTQRLAAKERAEQLANVQSTYPALKDKAAEFQSFLSNPEYSSMNIATAAKVFLVENDLLSSPQPRKGLESDTGGGRVVPTQGMTADDITNLRNTDFRKYSKMVREGKIKL